jgi:hypothetical protein
MTFYSPIVIFIYKRPLHLAKTLKSLSNCEGFEKHSIYIFGDGPKNENENIFVQETRNVAKSFFGDRAQYFFSNKNKGLANSVIDGVTDIINKYQSVIVIEDDLLLHSHFLVYMNNALNHYSSKENIFSVSGYMYETEILKGSKYAILLPIISTWGWGTWARAWSKLDSKCIDSIKLLENKKLRKNFDCNNNYPFSMMLKRQLNGSIDSWGIRWYWTIFRKDALTCFPPISLVKNNGFDNSATHGRGFLSKFGINKPNEILETKDIILFKENNTFDPDLYKKVCNSLYKLNGGFLGKLRDYIKKILLK